MMPPESRRNRDMSAWLGGLEPSWAMLDRASLDALMDESSAENRALRLADDLTRDELARSHANVSAMEEAMSWPDHDPADVRRYRKVLNEMDFRQLHLVRTLAEFGVRTKTLGLTWAVSGGDLAWVMLIMREWGARFASSVQSETLQSAEVGASNAAYSDDRIPCRCIGGCGHYALPEVMTTRLDLLRDWPANLARHGHANTRTETAHHASRQE